MALDIIPAHTFTSLKEYLEESDFADKISLRRDNDSGLILLHNEWNYSCADPFYRSCHSIVMKEGEGDLLKVLMYSGGSVSDDIRDKIDIKSLDTEGFHATVWESFEGPLVNVYHDGERWRYSSSRCVNINKSFFGGKTSHGALFNEIIQDTNAFESKLDVNKTYHFIMVHHLNQQLISYRDRVNVPSNQAGFLVHATTRRRDTHEEVFEHVEHPLVHYAPKMEVRSYDELVWHMENAWDAKLVGTCHLDMEGVMLELPDGELLKIHSKMYKHMQEIIPNAHTRVERFIRSFQNQTLDRNLELTGANPYLQGTTGSFHAKYAIHQSYVYASVLLYRLYMYFTIFDPSTGGYTKLNQPFFTQFVKGTLSFHMAKLQKLTIRYQQQLDYDQVRNHLLRYTDADELIKLLVELTEMDMAFMRYFIDGKDRKSYQCVRVLLECFKNEGVFAE